MQGKLIVIEGGDGSGKSTQRNLLADYLKEQGKEIVVTREPGGTPEGEAIREILKNPKYNLSPLVEFLLFCASRSHLYTTIIEPALERGKIVLTDRYWYSSDTYQGSGGGLNKDLIRDYSRNILRNKLHPDLAILIDVLATKGLETKLKEEGLTDRFNKKDLLYHTRVNKGYRELANKYPFIKVIKYREGDINGMQQEIRSHVDKLLNQ